MQSGFSLSIFLGCSRSSASYLAMMLSTAQIVSSKCVESLPMQFLQWCTKKFFLQRVLNLLRICLNLSLTQVLLAKHSSEQSWFTDGVLQIPYLNPSVFQCTSFRFFFYRSNLMLRLTSENETLPRRMSPMARYVLAQGLDSISWYFQSQMSLNIQSNLRGCSRGSAMLYSGASEDNRKWMSGQGTKFIVISLKSTFRMPSNLIEHVRLDNRLATIVFILLYAYLFLDLSSIMVPFTAYLPPCVLSLLTIQSTVSTMLINAWLSIGREQSACFITSCRENRELQGEVTTSSFSVDGNTEATNRNTYGKLSSKMVKMQLPRPDPVPPPMECVTKNDCKESHFSTWAPMFSARSVSYCLPYSQNPCAQLLPAPETSLTKFLWSNISPMSLLSSWLVTPVSISTTTALALRSLISLPTGRVESLSTLRKKELRASSQRPVLLYLECYWSSSYQNLQAIWLPH